MSKPRAEEDELNGEMKSVSRAIDRPITLVMSQDKTIVANALLSL
jgi:hypothetical protein